jgi:hypothetical protein
MKAFLDNFAAVLGSATIGLLLLSVNARITPNSVIPTLVSSGLQPLVAPPQQGGTDENCSGFSCRFHP